MWNTAKLGDVIEKGETINPTTNPDIQFRYIDVSSIDRVSFSISETQTLLGKDAPSRARRAVRTGDVLFATIRPTLQRVAIVPKNLNGEVCSTGYIVLRPKASIICSKFIFYYMLSEKVKAGMEGLQTGASYPAVNDTQVKNLNISYPPLAEQQRIVAKLDAAFAEIDGAIESAKKQANAASDYGYRIIETSLEELSEKYGLSSISKVAVIQPKKKLALEKLSEGDDVSFMGMNGLGIEKKYSQPEKNKKLSEVYKSYQYFEDDDVIFAKITPCFENGKLGIVKGLTNGIGFGSSEFVVLRTHADFQSEFLYYCLLNEVFRNDGAANMSGAVGHKRVTKEYFYNYNVPTPPLELQQLIINKFDEVWKNTTKIISSKHKKLEELTNLKSAILVQELQPPQSEAA